MSTTPSGTDRSSQSTTDMDAPSGTSEKSVQSIGWTLPELTASLAGDSSSMAANDSPNDTHSSAQDDAADETGSRSRSADVGRDTPSTVQDARDDAGNVIGSSQDLPVEQQQEDAHSTPRGTHAGAEIDSGNNGDGFQAPRRTARSPSPSMRSRPVDTTPRFFGSQLPVEEGEDDDGGLEYSETSAARLSGAAFTDGEGSGAPPQWTTQANLKTTRATSTPKAGSLLNDDDSFWNGLMRSLSPSQRKLLRDRERRMREMILRDGTSSSESKSNVIESEFVSAPTPSPSDNCPVSPSAPLPPLPVSGKGKARASEPEPVVVLTRITDDETDDSIAKQLEADARYAACLAAELGDLPPYEDLSPVEDECVPNAPGTSKAHAAAANEQQVAVDGLLASQLEAQLADEERDRKLAEELEQRELSNWERRKRAKRAASKESKYRQEEKKKRRELSPVPRRPTGTRVRLSPIDQVPRGHPSFRGLQRDLDSGNDAQSKKTFTRSRPSPDDSSSDSGSSSSSSSSADDHKRSRRSRKSRKSGKNRRRNAKRRKASLPVRHQSFIGRFRLSIFLEFNADSDDSKKTKNRKKREMRRYKEKMMRMRFRLSNAGVIEPDKYDGIAIFSKYTSFASTVKAWCKDCFLPRKMWVHYSGKWLTGKAKEWYNREVAPNAKRWKMRAFLRELFNEFFPVDFRGQQRSKFKYFTQNGRTIRQYRKALEIVADSIGDITIRGLVLQYWDGADLEYRERWADKGFDPETALIDDLEDEALKFEQSRKLEDLFVQTVSDIMQWQLRAAIPFPWDSFDDPEDDPFAKDRFSIIETQLGFLVCDAHTGDDHEVLLTQLEDEDFEFAEYIYEQKQRLDDKGELISPAHRQRLRECRERHRERVVSEVPEEPNVYDFLAYFGIDESDSEALEEVFDSIMEDLSDNAPYSFDPTEPQLRDALCDPSRFTYTVSRNPVYTFFLVNDEFHNCGFELPYSALVHGLWHPVSWLEGAWNEWPSSSSDSNSGSEDDRDGVSPRDDDEPPPPPTSLFPFRPDSPTSSDEPPELRDVSDTDVYSNSDSGWDSVSATDDDDTHHVEVEDTVRVFLGSAKPSRKPAPPPDEIRMQRNASKTQDFTRLIPKPMNGTFKLDIPPELKRRGIHPAFHSSLLRIHIPNDDRRFPGRQVAQVTGIGEGSDEWAVRKIIAHSGKGSDAKFEVEWMNGDTAWFPYKQVEHLSSLADYLQALNASSITHLPIGNGTPPDDAGVYLGTIGIKQGRKFSARTRPYPPSTMGDDYRREWDDAIARQRDDFVGHIFGAAKYALDAAVGKRSRPEEYDPDYREYLAQRQQEGPNYRGPSNRRFNDHYRAHSRPPSHSRYRQDDGHENHRPSRSRVPRFIDSWTPEPERYSSVRYVRPEDEPRNWGYREPTAAGVGNDSDSDDDRSDTEPTQNQPTVEQVTSAVGADTAPTGTKKADEQPKDAGDKGASVTPTPPIEDDAATTAALPFAGLDTVQVAQESGTSMDTDE
ncbi:CCHC-type domain-containing protein [Mycena kentingensis (nom. inval.)]|nr:CCHC-type domain-containing protein [Mycena kentingensis (nom. inval.)]